MACADFAVDAPLAVGQRAERELRLHPAREILRAPRQTTGRRTHLAQAFAFRQHLLRTQAAQACVEPCMRLYAVRIGETVLLVADGGRHAERLEDARAHEVFPWLPADLGHQFAGHDVQDVVVGIAAAKAGGRLDVPQGAHDVRATARRARNEQQVARPQAEAATVQQQVGDGHLARDPGVVHAEIRQAVGHLVVPRQLAVVDQDGEGRRGHRLAGGSGREDRVRIHRLGAAQPPHAIAFRMHDPAVLDDRDRHPRHVARTHGLLDPCVESCGHLRMRRRRRAQPCHQDGGERHSQGNVHGRSPDRVGAGMATAAGPRHSRQTPTVSSGRT